MDNMFMPQAPIMQQELHMCLHFKWMWKHWPVNLVPEEVSIKENSLSHFKHDWMTQFYFFLFFWSLYLDQGVECTLVKTELINIYQHSGLIQEQSYNVKLLKYKQSSTQQLKLIQKNNCVCSLTHNLTFLVWPCNL